MYKVNNPDLVKYTVATEWSEDNDGKMQVNQYEVIKELGSGSYGVVYLVRDTKTGNYYAMKELTKSKLRNKNRSTRSINPPTIYGKRDSGGPLIGGRYAGFMRRSSSFKKEQKDPFYLIKEELAICKKLNHRNVTRLYEVLNDPEQDMLYMVIELCEAGPVMKVTLNGTNIMDESNARNYFIQSLLGLEYLHENGIAHRDIKPDNMLLTRDDVLKLSDFGEAYMFIGKGKDGDGGSDNDEIDDDDATMDSRSTGMTLAGTEAFMAPELLEGNLNPNLMPSADIWALGVSLYCFLYDKLPYERCEGQLEIADSIYHKRLVLDSVDPPSLKDLLRRMLTPSSTERITIKELKQHQWVTNNGQIELPSTEDNCKNSVTEVTDSEVNNAIHTIYDIMPVIQAIAKLRLIRRRIRDRKEQEKTANQQKSTHGDDDSSRLATGDFAPNSSPQ